MEYRVALANCAQRIYRVVLVSVPEMLSMVAKVDRLVTRIRSMRCWCILLRRLRSPILEYP